MFIKNFVPQKTIRHTEEKYILQKIKKGKTMPPGILFHHRLIYGPPNVPGMLRFMGSQRVRHN